MKEEDLQEFLFSGETLLFWAEDAKIRPNQGFMREWMHLDGQVPTYTAKMYEGKNIVIRHQKPVMAKDNVSKQNFSPLGTLMLTDKRMLLVHCSNVIYCEILYDTDLTRNLVQMFTAKNIEVANKFHKANPLKRFAMGYQMLYDKDLQPIPAIQVLSGAWDEGRDVIIETSTLSLKKDLTPPPIKNVRKDKYAIAIYHPWSSAHSIGAIIAQTAAVLTGDVILATLMAMKLKKHREQYNPILDIVETKAPPMAKMISDLSMPLPPPPPPI